jgi:hypothetical protein
MNFLNSQVTRLDLFACLAEYADSNPDMSFCEIVEKMYRNHKINNPGTISLHYFKDNDLLYELEKELIKND